jgi:hypothetical protein
MSFLQMQISHNHDMACGSIQGWEEMHDLVDVIIELMENICFPESDFFS